VAVVADLRTCAGLPVVTLPCLQWCLNVEGFTGWLPYVSIQREWANGGAFKLVHPLAAAGADDGSGGYSSAGGGVGDSQTGQQQQQQQQQQRRLARLLTAATCVLNVAAQRDRLLFGGGWQGRAGQGRMAGQ
jgi:hypothetical protein